MTVVNGKSVNARFDLSARGSGVLLHVSSLPGAFGIGDLGPNAEHWIDMLADADQRWWQILPLGPCGEGNSPYRAYSAFAGNPLLISPERLLADGLISQSDLKAARLPAGKVDYSSVQRSKTKLLRAAFSEFEKRKLLNRVFLQFIQSECAWLDDYALFMALLDESPEGFPARWPTPLLGRKPAAMAEVKDRLADAIAFHKFTQFIFFRQLDAVRTHARKAGVAIIGDLPIFVSPESADVWANPPQFQLDKRLRPTAIAGVPPDLFSATGQCWGNPLYNWKKMAGDQFSWWKARLAAAFKQADLVRIDHFRGFEAYWKIPARSATAEFGKWVKAPGEELFEELLREHPHLPLIAEDLGVITPEVEALRDRFGLPGMRVLQFGFGDDPANPHTPCNFIPHCFAYTGTHDNDTTAGWYRNLSATQRKLLDTYAPEDWKADPAWAMMRMLSASVANNVIIPAQDLLRLGSDARMNTPGQGVGNWEWRLDSLSDCAKPLERLAGLTRVFNRKSRTRAARSSAVSQINETV